MPYKILVVAQCGRMLVQYLTGIGIEVVVVDCFADLDTEALALECIQVPSLQLKDIEYPVQRLQNRHQLTYVIYGSGLEQYCDSLLYLESLLTVLGNNSTVFKAVQNKVDFFKRLDRLGITHPETTFAVPVNHSDWLIKPLQGQGGLGISRYFRGQAIRQQSIYWQRYINGIPFSALFVARKNQIDIVGYQRQIIEKPVDDREFVFSGVMSSTDLSTAGRNLIRGWIEKLVTDYSLVGLNGLDFILKEQQCYLLEINARPTASVQLFDFPVMVAHIKASTPELQAKTLKQTHSWRCNCFSNAAIGKKPAVRNSQPWVYRAYKIIYAKNDLLIRQWPDWPAWVMDRPRDGSKIGQGEPVCSIMASAKTSRQLLDNLNSKRQVIENYLYIGI